MSLGAEWAVGSSSGVIHLDPQMHPSGCMKIKNSEAPTISPNEAARIRANSAQSSEPLHQSRRLTLGEAVIANMQRQPERHFNK